MRTIFFMTVLAVTMAAAQQTRPQWIAPESAGSRENPLQNRPELVAGGEKLFTKNCASCHRAPKQRGPELSAPDVQRQKDGELFWKITHGNARSGMPSFSSLPEAQRWQLVLYIRRLSAGDPAH